MQRIEINKDLDQSYRQIAYGLKEIKETAFKVSQSAKRILKLLEDLQKREELNDEQAELLARAIAQYQIIADGNDPWPEITTEALSSEASITNLFYQGFNRIQDTTINAPLKARMQAYLWITYNIGALAQLINETQLSAEEAQVVQDNLYTPMQRAAKLKAFLEGFKQALTQGQRDLLRPVVDAMHTHTNQLGRKADRHIPKAGQPMSKAAELMLSKLELFAPVDLDKNNFEYALDDLSFTISTVEFSGDFKLRLEKLFHQIKLDVIKQKLNKISPEKIDASPAMKLCYSTQELLDVVLSNRPDAEKSKALQTYESKCYETSVAAILLKLALAVVIAAAITVVVAAFVCGIAAIIGTLAGGPAATVPAAVAGLFQGGKAGAGIGVAVASSVTGVTLSGVVSYHTMFKKPKMVKTSIEVAKEAKTAKPLALHRLISAS